MNNNLVCPSPANLLLPLQRLKSLVELDLSENWDVVSIQGLLPLASLPKLRLLDLGRGPKGHEMAGSSDSVCCLNDFLEVAGRLVLLLRNSSDVHLRLH